MKNIRILLISILILMMYALSANAFYFYGNTLNASSTLNVSNTNVTVEVYKMVSGQGPVLNTSNSSLSNADGFFNVSVPDIQEDNIMCKIKIKHFISGTEDIDLIGPSLPELPSQEIQQLSPINFYMRDGAAINITAVNFSGGATVFNYMIKDKKLGYPIESDWSNYHSAVTVYLPADRNYSIMIFPNQSFPVSYDLNNASDYDNNHADIVFNVSEQWKRVSGYALAGNSSPNADDITIISYLIEPGNMLFQDHPIPYNLSAWDCGAGGCGTDEYNATTGFYNITLPGAAMGANIMMFATVRNGTDYYGALRNITLTYDGENETSFNFSLQTLLGDVTNISVNNAGAQGSGKSTVNIETKKLSFYFVNTTGSNITSLNFAHVEMDMDYSSTYTNGPSFTWMLDVSSSDSGRFTVPMISADISKINVFCQDYAPLKTSKTSSQLNSGDTSINLTAFSPGGIEGDIEEDDLQVDMLKSNSECDVPYPDASCSLLPSNEKDFADFKPFKIVLGGGKISFKMIRKSNNLTVLYKNVDMLASGPPDALFDSSSNDTTGDTSLEAAWRFGSMGPEIYDSILVGVPYNDSQVDESAPIKVLLDKLYDNKWNIIWNVTNGTDSLPSDYSDFNVTWFNDTAGGMTCSLTDVNADCYVNTTYNMIWLNIPHFSGIGPTVKTTTVGGVTLTTNTSSLTCDTNCIVYINVTNENYSYYNDLVDINVSIIDSALVVDTYNISYYNGSEFVLNATFNTTNANTSQALYPGYNLTQYNSSDSNTTHQYKLDINVTSTTETVVNFTYWVNSTPISLTVTLNPTSSPTSSGGGGGSGSTTTTQNIVLAKTDATYTGLARKSKLVFDLGKESHCITINKVYADRTKVEFILTSEPIYFTLSIGEEKTIDVGSNEKLYVKLTGIKNRKADIIVKKIVKKPLTVIPPAEKKEEVKEEVSVEEEEIEEVTPITPEKQKLPLTWMIVALVVVIGLITYFVVSNKKRI